MAYIFANNKGYKELKIEDVRERVSKILTSTTVNAMAKVRAKCWLYHSESRCKNGNVPYTFDVYSNHVGKAIYISYIESDLINCDDLGGKQKALDIVNKWYS